MKILLVYFLLIGLPPGFEPQSAKIDSLERALSTTSDTSKVITLSELCWQNRNISKAKAFSYGHAALSLARKLKYERGIAQAHNDLGILYADQSKYTEALSHYHQALIIRRKLNDLKGQAALYNKTGIINQTQGNLRAALQNQLEALSIYNKLNFDYGIAQSLNNVGIIYFNLGNPEQALKYHQNALLLKQKIGDQKGYAASLVNIANIYKQTKNLKTAIAYDLKARKILLQLHDKEYLPGVLNNLASLYQQQKNLGKALVYAKEAYQLRSETQDIKGMASALLNLGDIYKNLNQPATAESYFNKGLLLAKSIDATPEIIEAYRLLAQTQAEKKQYASAFQNQLRYSQLRDSTLNEELNNQIAGLQTKFEARERENQLALLKRKHQIRELKLNQQNQILSRQQTQLFLILAGMICFGLVGLIIYNRKTLNQRIALKRNLLHQNRLRSQAVLEAEDKERKRIGTDLHDGLGQMISIAKLNLTGLQEDICLTDETHKTLLRNSLTMLDEAFKEVRLISHNLGVSALQHHDITRALQHLLNTFSQTEQFEIQFETIGFSQEKVPAVIEKVIYRVVQECLNNILKHARATIISVQLIRHEKEITLMLEDNGTGFDPENLPHNSGIGLANIRSRVEYLNGTVNIDSVINRGTIVTIEIPLNAVSLNLQDQSYEHEQILSKHPLTVS